MLETTVAGSLPKPAWLAEPEKLWAPWRLAGGELEQGMREEIPHEALIEAFKSPEQKKEPTLRTPDGRRVTKWLPSRSAPKGPR